MALQIDDKLTVPDDAVSITFVRSPGPGGQHVNKVATAVQLRFAIARAQLPEAMVRRLHEQAGGRINKDGELIIFAHRFRSQQRNRDDALARLAALLEAAAQEPKPQIKTRVPASAKRRRREAKHYRSRIKQLRDKPKLDS
jgi:ribosome-associated protein